MTEGIASVTQGLTNQISDSIQVTHARPPRALERSFTEEKELILVPFDLAAAQAQFQVYQWAKKGNYVDSYLAYISLGFEIMS